MREAAQKEGSSQWLVDQSRQCEGENIRLLNPHRDLVPQILGALSPVGPRGRGVDDGRGLDVNRVDRSGAAADGALGRRDRERGEGDQEGEFHVVGEVVMESEE